MTELNNRMKENLAEASRKTYEGSCTMLILWMLQHYPNLIPAEYKEESKEHSADEETFVKSTIFRNLKFHPIIFSEFTGRHSIEWLSTLKRPNGDWFTYSAYTNHRAGLYRMHVNYDVDVSEGMKLSIDEFFRALPKQKYESNTKSKARKNNASPSMSSKKRKSVHFSSCCPHKFYSKEA